MGGAGSIFTGFVGLAGAAIGGFTSFMASWLTVRAQMRQRTQTAARTRRERVYTAFIREAARLFGDALVHQREDASDLVSLYALVAQMRLFAPEEVMACADGVLDTIIAAYLGPNHTLHDLRQFARDGGMDSVRRFSEACRMDLERFDET
jgi:hypothetical protein